MCRNFVVLLQTVNMLKDDVRLDLSMRYSWLRGLYFIGLDYMYDKLYISGNTASGRGHGEVNQSVKCQLVRQLDFVKLNT